MSRTDNDTWDLATSVGATATMVAAARAVATRADDPLIDDRFAEPLVTAVGIDFFTKLARGDLDNLAMFDDDSPVTPRRMADGMAARTKFFDEFFLEATGAGIRQAVILAAGLDSRAYRLPWPDGTTVYEVDQPEVIAFKTTTLEGLGATPTADRRTVAIDLRQDWPKALRDAGFDPERPTVWIAEGLLPYLPSDAQDLLLDNITALSAPGSRFATEGIADFKGVDEDETKERIGALMERWRDYGFDFDMSNLFYYGERKVVDEYLRTHDWETVRNNSDELLTRYGLEVPDKDGVPFGEVLYVKATLGGNR